MSLIDRISTVSLIINVILIVISVGLAVDAWKERERRNCQVKIWMEQANGVNQGLQRIIQDKWNNLYSSINDITNAVHSVHASAFSLYQSLYEERVLTEKEYKDHAMKIRKKMDEKMGLVETQKPENTKSELSPPVIEAEDTEAAT